MDTSAPKLNQYAAPAPYVPVSKKGKFAVTDKNSVAPTPSTSEAFCERIEFVIQAPQTVTGKLQHTFIETTSREVDSKIQKTRKSSRRSKTFVPEIVEFVTAEENFVVPTPSKSKALLSERIEFAIPASSTVPRKSQDTILRRTSSIELPCKAVDSIWTIGIVVKRAQEDFSKSGGGGININHPLDHVQLAWSILHCFQRGPSVPCGQWVNVPILIEYAEQALGRNIKYDKDQFRQLDLQDFSEADYRLNDEALARGESLEDIIERQLIPRRMHGATVSTIREVFKDDPGIEATITLLAEGQ